MGTSFGCTLSLSPPTTDRTSSCAFLSIAGLRISSAIAHTMVTELVSTPAVKTFESSPLMWSLVNRREPWTCGWCRLSSMRSTKTSMRSGVVVALDGGDDDGSTRCWSMMVSKKASRSLNTLSRRAAAPVRRSTRRPAALG